MDDMRTATEQPVVLPFPESDYDEKGNLKKVRGRVLKKLLKYEFKAVFKPIFIPAVIVLAVAFYLFAFGFLIDFNAIVSTAKFVLWIMTFMLFVYGLLFMLVFPLIICMNRYSHNLFGSDGYLSLSIPASPEEQILAKRISQYVMLFGALLVVVVSLLLALIPVMATTDMGGSSSAPDGNERNWVVLIFDVLHALISIHVFPLFVASAFSFLKCKKHRGLPAWVVVLVCIGTFLTITYGAALIATLVEEGLLIITDAFLSFVKWFLLALACVAIYGIWRYEIQTLRCKVNLK